MPLAACWHVGQLSDPSLPLRVSKYCPHEHMRTSLLEPVADNVREVFGILVDVLSDLFWVLIDFFEELSDICSSLFEGYG